MHQNHNTAQSATLLFLSGPLIISIFTLISYMEGMEQFRYATFFYIIFMDQISAYYLLPIITREYHDSIIILPLFFVINISINAFLVFSLFGGFKHKQNG